MDQSFRFISDPTHKENLSGRVTAACLNCRRKKIKVRQTLYGYTTSSLTFWKCSGELNCSTCRERGLVCEGPPQRKRPRRDDTNVSSNEASAIAAYAQGTGVRRNPSLETPIVPPRFARFDSTRTEDSGYTSGRHSADVLQSATTPPKPSNCITANEVVHTRDAASPIDASASASPLSAFQQVSPFSLNVPHICYGVQGVGSPMIVGRSDHSLPNRGDSMLYTDCMISPRAFPTSQVAQGHPTTVPSRLAEWIQPQPSDDWWPNNRHDRRLSQDLITAAEALEEQALSLRALALERQREDFDGVMRRRTLGEAQSRLSDTGVQVMLPFDCSNFQQNGSVDYSELFCPDGTLHSGFTAQDCEPTGFWALDNQVPYQSLQQTKATLTVLRADTLSINPTETEQMQRHQNTGV